MSRLRGGIPRALPSHRSRDGVAYGAYCRATVKRLGPLSVDAMPTVSDWSSPLISAGSGLAGVWLGAWLSGRRERWTGKRDVYVALLEGFQQMLSACGRLESGAKHGIPTSDKEGLLADLQSRIQDEFADAREKLHNAIAIARIALPASTLTIIDKYLEEDVGAADREGAVEMIRGRREALQRARDDIATAARADLKITTRRLS